MVSAVSLIVAVRIGWEWLAAVGMFGQTAGAIAAFALAHREIRPHAVAPPAVHVADLTPSGEGLPGGVFSLLVPLGVILAAALYLHVNWDRLPAELPVHWDRTGVPDRWVVPTWRRLYGQLVLCAIMVLFMLGMAELILHASPRGRIAGTEGWTRRFRRTNLLLLVAGVWAMSALISLNAILPLVWGGARPPALAWIAPILILGTTLPFVVQMVRLTKEQSSGSDGTPDSCWKMGLLYYNPSDPALLVEKRFGLGYTVNFGSHVLWWILGAGVLLLLFTRVVLS
jgi:uncharacterized membrane protein